jgi:hypothetical protein
MNACSAGAADGERGNGDDDGFLEHGVPFRLLWGNHTTVSQRVIATRRFLS